MGNLKSSGCGAPADKENALQNAEINNLRARVDGLGASTAFTVGFKAQVIIVAVISILAMVISLAAFITSLNHQRDIVSVSKEASAANVNASRALTIAEKSAR